MERVNRHGGGTSLDEKEKKKKKGEVEEVNERWETNN